MLFHKKELTNLSILFNKSVVYYRRKVPAWAVPEQTKTAHCAEKRDFAGVFPERRRFRAVFPPAAACLLCLK
jgi:hypothetical protein